MRTWLGTLVVIALAVGLALLLREHSGNVLIVAQPWRVELSLTLATLLIIAAFIVLYVVLRFFAWLASRPGQYRSWKTRRAQKKDLHQLQRGWISLLEGRFSDVESDLRKLLSRTRSSQTRVLAALGLARAYQQKADYGRRDEALDIAKNSASNARLHEATQIVQAEMYLEQNRPQEALEKLAGFEQAAAHHTTATRLLLHAHHQLKHYDKVYSLTRLLVRRKVIDAEQAAPLIEVSAVARLKENGPEGFRPIWNDLKPTEKTQPKIAATAAAIQKQAGNYEEARKILEAALSVELDPKLLSRYAHCPPDQVAKRLSKAEAWLKDHPDNPDLLITLGSLCLIGQPWGPAERYLQRSKKIRPDVKVHALLGNLYDGLGRKDEAFRHWKLAASGAYALPTVELSRLLPAADTADDPMFFQENIRSSAEGEASNPVIYAASAVGYVEDDALDASRPGTLAEKIPEPDAQDSLLDDYFDSAPPPGVDFSQSSDQPSKKTDSH